jgi:hypothetical protein
MFGEVKTIKEVPLTVGTGDPIPRLISGKPSGWHQVWLGLSRIKSWFAVCYIDNQVNDVVYFMLEKREFCSNNL